MVTESVASGVAFGGTDVAFAMRRRRLRRDLPARLTIKNIRERSATSQGRAPGHEWRRVRRLCLDQRRSARHLSIA